MHIRDLRDDGTVVTVGKLSGQVPPTSDTHQSTRCYHAKQRSDSGKNLDSTKPVANNITVKYRGRDMQTPQRRQIGPPCRGNGATERNLH